jgi:hypothetical protein
LSAALLIVGDAAGQSLTPAWSVQAGYSHSKDGKGLHTEALYDVPIADLYFTPSVKILFADNSMFSIDVMVKWLLWQHAYISFGGSVMTWEDRASIGVPVDIGYILPVSSYVELDIGINATPFFFLGPEKDGAMFGIFAGLRIPVR